MSETACCAHLRVSYQTEELPNIGTHGWWACDAYGKRFAPINNTASDGETVRPVKSATVHAIYEDAAEWLCFPQEPEEPAPISWWSRVWRWFR